MRDTEASRHTTPCAMINHETQVSGLAIRPKEEWPKTLSEGVENLRYLCGGEDDFRRHEPFGVLNDSDLLRFLLARGGNVPKAIEMLREVLRWRTRRMPYFLLVDPNSDVAQCFATEARTGKIIVAGPDKFGLGWCSWTQPWKTRCLKTTTCGSWPTTCKRLVTCAPLAWTRSSWSPTQNSSR